MVAANAVVTIHAPGDAGKTPIALQSTTGMPLPNPVTVNDMGYGPAFIAGLDRVAWTGGEFTGFFTAHDSIKQDAVAAADRADRAQLAAEEAANRAGAPVGEAVVRELADGKPANTVVKEVAATVTAPVARRLDVAADPLAYLNSIDVLCSWQTRDPGTVTFPQGMNINEEAGEIYVANQDSGTLLRIDVRNLDGTLKHSKSVQITTGAYTESLPYWYNTTGDLCFIIRTGAGNNPATGHYTYNTYNYTKGTLSPQIPIQGGIRADVDGDYMITSDMWTTTISKVWVYDWASVKNGTPRLVNTINLAVTGETVAKNQGLVLNGGYIFLLQGAADTSPTITVYNLAGQLVNIYGVRGEDFANALNQCLPGAITNPQSFAYENEGGCKYQGKLATLEVVNNGSSMTTSRSVVVIHNIVGGAVMPVDLRPTYVHDTGWINLELINGAITYGADTIPRIRRIGKEIYLEGAVKGVTAGNTDVAVIPNEFLPAFNRQFVQAFGGGGQTASWQITAANNGGRVRLMGVSSGTITATSWFPVAHNWAQK